MGVGDMYRSMFPILRFASLALAAVAFLSASTWAPKAQSLVRVVLELYIAAFLLVRFSPVSPREPLRDFDRQAAFYAGVLILLAATSELVPRVGDRVKNKIRRILGLEPRNSDQ